MAGISFPVLGLSFPFPLTLDSVILGTSPVWPPEGDRAPRSSSTAGANQPSPGHPCHAANPGRRQQSVVAKALALMSRDLSWVRGLGGCPALVSRSLWGAPFVKQRGSTPAL